VTLMCVKVDEQRTGSVHFENNSRVIQNTTKNSRCHAKRLGTKLTVMLVSHEPTLEK
jgi:hypothetical protein